MKSILLQSSGGAEVVGYIAAIVISVLLFIALRGLILWYYKIDVISKNLEDQTKTQKRILEILEAQSKKSHQNFEK